MIVELVTWHWLRLAKNSGAERCRPAMLSPTKRIYVKKENGVCSNQKKVVGKKINHEFVEKPRMEIVHMLSERVRAQLR